MTAEGETPKHEISIAKLGQAAGYGAKDRKEEGRMKVFRD